MATITSASLSSPAAPASSRTRLLADIRAFWRQFFDRAFDPYRPELHYMRGPGPAWRAKHTAVSPRPIDSPKSVPRIPPERRQPLITAYLLRRGRLHAHG